MSTATPKHQDAVTQQENSAQRAPDRKTGDKRHFSVAIDRRQTTDQKETSDQAADTAKQILALFEADRKKIERLGRPAASALRVHQYLQSKPILSVPTAVAALKLTAPTVRKSVGHLTDLGMVRETTGKQRDRLFVYSGYLDILNQGTEPL